MGRLWNLDIVSSPGRPCAPLAVISALVSEVFSRKAFSRLVVEDEEYLARALLGSDLFGNQAGAS